MKRAVAFALAMAAMCATGALAEGTRLDSTQAVDPKVPVLVNCGELMAEPWNLTLACGDANYELTGMTWSGWGKAIATGKGFAHVNDCKPTCVAGHFEDFPVVATAGIRSACASGQAQYTRLVLTYSGKRPAGIGPRDTWKFPCGIEEPGPTITTATSPGRKVILVGTGWPVDHTRARTCDKTVALAYQRNGKGAIGQAKLDRSGRFEVTWTAPKAGFVVITAKQSCNGVTPPPAHSLDGFYYILVAVEVLE